MSRTLRIAAMADMHFKKEGTESLRAVFTEIAKSADVLALCGDITDYGLPEEAHVAVGELRAAPLPIVAELGNHDVQSGEEKKVIDVLEKGGVQVLDVDPVEIAGVGFAGSK